jgi:outer membrane autotransporter protein
VSTKKISSKTYKQSLLAVSIGLLSPMLWAESGESREGAETAETVLNGVGVETVKINGIERTAIVVDGVSHTVSDSVDPAHYLVRNSGTLNVMDGAVVESVNVNRSRLNVDSSEVRGGVAVMIGEATIDSARITNSADAGLRLTTDISDATSRSTAHVANSVIEGAGFGVTVSVAGEVWLRGTQVDGVGVADSRSGNGGMSLIGGIAHVLDASHVRGDESGIRITNHQYDSPVQINRLHIDSSTVTARTGSAIEIRKRSATSKDKTVADILISNNSRLDAGNGRLIDVKQESTANVEVNNSALTGNMFADDTSTLNVTLRNHGRLDGNIVNGNAVVIDSSGHWQLGGDNAIKSLALDGGSVGFSEDGIHTLTVGQLSGRGLFNMGINLDDGTGDLLNVTGTASGRHLLNVRNTGEEAVPAEFEALRVVHTEGGDAQFGLIGGRADLGVYSYALEQQGNDWFIVGSGKTISPSTQSALALFNVGPTIWNSELTTLRSRMGEVRGREEGGGWIRSYGNRFKASLDSGVDYQQKQHGLSFGADAPVPVGDGQLLVGLMGGYSKSSLDLSRGTSGEVDSYYLGAYGTWLSNDGYYLDGVLKVNQFHNSSKVAMSDGEKAKGDYSNRAVGGSVEFGKHIKLADDYFVEPYAQVSGVWIDGSSYTLDNGLQARTSQTQSVLGKVGTSVGRQFALKDGGVLQPYVRVAAAHEFSRNNDVKVNDQRFDNDLFGSRAELGAGVSVSLSERLQMHADFDYMKGKHVEQPWGANVGLRLAF